MADRAPDHGYLPWDQLKPGESLEIPRTYHNLPSLLNHRFPDRLYTGTIKGAPDDKRILIRLA